jgi:hypothetical protein
MGAFPQLAVLFQGGIAMGCDLGAEVGIQRGPFLGRSARNGLDREGARFAALLQIPLDSRHRNLKGCGDLGLAMALIAGSQDPLAQVV